MKKNFKRRVFSAFAFTLLAAALFAGCNRSARSAASDGAKVLKVAYEFDGMPFSYKDENGNDTGADVELFRLAEKYLPGYQFEFIGTGDDDLVVGVTTGAYDIGLSNAFYTKERGERYLIPRENVGGAFLGLAVRNEHSDITTFKQIAERGLKVSPLIAGNGITFQFEQYNEQNPNAQIKIEYSTDYAVWQKQFDWLNEGRYDVVPTLQVVWDQQVAATDGVHHALLNKFKFNPLKPVKSYPLVSKVTLDNEFTSLLSEALAKAKTEPKMAELAVKFYGVNIYEYPYEAGW